MSPEKLPEPTGGPNDPIPLSRDGHSHLRLLDKARGHYKAGTGEDPYMAVLSPSLYYVLNEECKLMAATMSTGFKWKEGNLACVFGIGLMTNNTMSPEKFYLLSYEEVRGLVKSGHMNEAVWNEYDLMIRNLRADSLCLPAKARLEDSEDSAGAQSQNET